MTEIAFVALGSNLGDREQYLTTALQALGAVSHSRLVAATAIEETAPLGGLDQPPFLNQMVALETTLTPHALLAALHGIERAAGRERRERWGSRTLDLDLVCYGALRMADHDLELPHPGLPARDFWQRELRELKRILATPVCP